MLVIYIITCLIIVAKINKVLKPCQRIKNAMEHEGDGDTYCNLCGWNDPQSVCKGPGRVRNQRMSQDHPNYSIVKIDQNTEKSPGDLRRLAVTQTPVKNHQLTLV